MVNVNEFTSGETVYFRLGEDGNLYVCLPDEMGLDRDVLGHAIIERVDVDTKTIWFTAPLTKAITRRA